MHRKSRDEQHMIIFVLLARPKWRNFPIILQRWCIVVGECCRLRERIDITRANQKPLLHIARTNHLAVFDIANKLYTLDAILEYKQFVLAITTKLYTLDAILEYSLF